ncbi:MAG: hypothetical protein QXX94_08150 [Candidatus Bathyarchaeia archaeon]
MVDIWVRIEFFRWYNDYLAPTVINGETRLSGKIKKGDTMILITDLKVTFEGTYLIGSKVISYINETEEGYGTTYYVSVRDGKLIGITDAKGRTPPSLEVSTVKVG